MGNWSMHIRGCGPHDNGKPYDAEALMVKAMDMMRQAGQSLIDGYITVGGEKNEASARNQHPELVQVDVAAEAYAAYSASTDNKNFQGGEMPAFENLPPQIKDAWQAAVTRARQV